MKAICYHEKEEYTILQYNAELYIVATKLVADDNIARALPGAVVFDTLLGSDLQGCHYSHPLDQGRLLFKFYILMNVI